MSSRVAESEAAMLEAVRAVLTAAPTSQLRAWLRTSSKVPEHIGPTAMKLLTDSLRKGAVRALVRRGAWRHRRALIEGQVVEGRLWQLRPALSLRFSRASFGLCRWLAGASDTPPTPKTAADELLFYLAAHACVRTGISLKPLASSSLAWLGFAGWFDCAPASLRWTRLLSGDGQIIVDALQPDLTAHWVGMERHKPDIGVPRVLSDFGQRQREALTTFLDALEACDRRDLAGFAVNAAAQLLHRPARAWTEGIADSGTPLAERGEASRSSAAFLRLVARIAGWRRELSSVAFFDDNYAEAQFLLDSWENLGVEGFRRTAAIADELESLRTLSATTDQENSHL